MRIARVWARAGTRSWPRLGVAALVAVVVAMGSGVGAPTWAATGAGKPGTTRAIRTDHTKTDHTKTDHAKTDHAKIDRTKPAAATNARPGAGRRAGGDAGNREPSSVTYANRVLPS